MSQSTHALQPYWDLLLAGMQADVLEAALETGVLDALATPLTAPALADKLQLDVMRLEPVLDVLCGLGVLSYQLCEAECLTTQRHYRVTDVSAAHWRRDAEHMCIDAWRFRYKAMRGAGRRIAQALRGREPSVRENEDAEQGKQWAAAARQQIHQEQRAITVAAAMATLDAVPHLDTVAHFADLGGGAGNIAMALAERWPQAQGEIVELTEPAEVARQHIADAGLSDRLRARTGKLAEGAPARGYDLIWCSSVLHFVPDLDACLADIYRALAPGGVFVSAHAEWPEATVSAQSHRVMSYYLPLRLRDCYVSGPGELLNRLKVAGFRHVSHWEVGSFPVAPLQAHAARKADR